MPKVKVHYLGYGSAFDAWVSINMLKSKALPKDKDRGRQMGHGQLIVLQVPVVQKVQDMPQANWKTAGAVLMRTPPRTIPVAADQILEDSFKTLRSEILVVQSMQCRQ